MKIDLSNSEWKLMNRLWQTSPMTITELTAALREDTGWSKNTVITMLSRLEGKEAVAGDVNGRDSAVNVIRTAIDHYVDCFCK